MSTMNKKSMREKRAISFLLAIMLVLTAVMYMPVQCNRTYAASINKSKINMTVGKSYQLSINEAKSAVKWSSSNKSVATVSAKGRIKAKKGGTAVIKAKTGGKTYKCYITVKCKTHNWNDGTVTKQPTCSETGIEEIKCRDCGKTKTKSIAKTDHDYEKTGYVEATKDKTGSTKYKCRICGDEKTEGTTYYRPSEQQAYNDIMAMKSSYPEGMSWTNDNYYEWNAGIYSGGYGCMGFAFALSDAAFGTLTPATSHSDLNNIKVGDILRINNDTHSVVVLSINGDTITIVEGNYNSSIHWGRTLSKKDLEGDSQLYILTRYQ